jgi:CheY-like chemotaxis protein
MNSTILLVDDNQAILDLMALTLERKGFKVVKTTDSQEVMHMLDLIQPHLIISDLMMPGLDGLALCEQIRMQPEHTALPILIVSAKNDPGAIEACLQAGATEYAVKPITPHNLISTVHRLLDTRLDLCKRK